MPSNFASSYKNSGLNTNISCNPLISIITVFNCFTQSSPFSRIGINFQT
nr:MAG TPA: hypothetical protein [Caudoviricetes sp.]